MNPEVVLEKTKTKKELSSPSHNQEEIILDDESIENNFVPVSVNKKNNDPVMSSSTAMKTLRNLDGLELYIKEISRYQVLSLEEEQKLTKEFIETGDIEIAKQLVQANLRLVVKIALEYRHAFQNMLDLIQEGNIGLMKAVSKYDPSKGAKLSYYASWWIRSYILKYILDNFRLVKVGTTAEQKKLFYNLMREKERLLQLGIKPDTKTLADNLNVSEKALIEMDQRLSSGSSDLSLDQKVNEDSSQTILDFIIDDKDGIDEKLANEQGLKILTEHLQDFLKTLKERDREIFTKRLLAEVPESLQSIADEYGVSRERIRQVEERLIEKLKVYMSDFIR